MSESMPGWTEICSAIGELGGHVGGGGAGDALDKAVGRLTEAIVPLATRR